MSPISLIDETTRKGTEKDDSLVLHPQERFESSNSTSDQPPGSAGRPHTNLFRPDPATARTLIYVWSQMSDLSDIHTSPMIDPRYEGLDLKSIQQELSPDEFEIFLETVGSIEVPLDWTRRGKPTCSSYDDEDDEE